MSDRKRKVWAVQGSVQASWSGTGQRVRRAHRWLCATSVRRRGVRDRGGGRMRGTARGAWGGAHRPRYSEGYGGVACGTWVTGPRRGCEDEGRSCRAWRGRRRRGREGCVGRNGGAWRDMGWTWRSARREQYRGWGWGCGQEGHTEGAGVEEGTASMRERRSLGTQGVPGVCMGCGASGSSQQSHAPQIGLGSPRPSQLQAPGCRWCGYYLRCPQNHQLGCSSQDFRILGSLLR